ncbi:hypothetical protein C9439_06250 [archaeon SCG-AAA382B04]|nr:hypothetical protein C9439_06250 [archaeon SCG-AAA382B04]
MNQKELFELFQKITNEIKREIKKIEPKEASKITQIGANGQPTRKIDKKAEEIAINHLKEHKNDFKLISEETGKIKIGKNPNITIVLDPLDGTHNFLKNITLYSTSIAVLDSKKNIIFSYVRDYEENSTYHTRNDKSYENKKPIKTSEIKDLSNSSISFYYDNSLKLEKFSDIFNHFRRLGCISLELCYVADGRLDAFIDLRGAGIIDIIAGFDLVKKAGGECKTLNTKFPNTQIQKNIKTIASNKYLKKPLLEALEK